MEGTAKRPVGASAHDDLVLASRALHRRHITWRTSHCGTGELAPSPRSAGISGPADRGVSVTVGVVEGLLCGLLYSVGWSRAFSYDASRTVQQFVTVDSFGEVFRQDRFNNHPLFSLVDHLVYRATGSQDERLLRVAPIIFAALTVGVVSTAVSRRFGARAGAVAGALLALNSLGVRHFREVRGYSLVTLLAVLGTMALFKRLREPSTVVTLVYAATMAAAISTHLFVLGLLVLHAVIVLSTAPSLLRNWIGPWLAATAIGLWVQLPAIVDGLTMPPVYRFQPTFPLALGANLLSGGGGVAGALLLVWSGWTVLKSRRWVPPVIVCMTALSVAAWMAAPSWLSSRYFVWLLPATAVAAGVGVVRRPRLLYVAVATVLAQLFTVGPWLYASEVPNRIATEYAKAARLDGLHVCALGRTRASLRAYAGELPVVWNPQELAACQVAIEAAGPSRQPLTGAACDRFPYVLSLPARYPGALFADKPVILMRSDEGEELYRGPSWITTSSADICLAHD